MSQEVNTISKLIKKTATTSPWKVVAAVSSIGVAIGSAIILYKYHATPHDNIPMLASDELSMIGGHLSVFIRNRGKFQQWLYHTLKKEGFPSIACMARFNQHLLFITNPIHVRYIFETNFGSANKGIIMTERFKELLGDGIFTSNGERWRFHRKIASRMFSMRNLKNFFYDTSLKNVCLTINKLHDFNHKTMDINDLLGRFTLDTFCEIAFGQSIHSVAEYPKTNAFGTSFDDMVERSSLRASDMLWKIKRALNIGKEYTFHGQHMIIRQFVDDIVNKKNEISSKMSDETGSASYDILSLYLKHNPDLTHKELYDIVVNFIIAGRDTTRMLLSWWIWELCREENKEIRDKLYKEIDDFERKPTYSDFKKAFEYLEQTLCETLRLHPPVPMLGRICVEDIPLLKIDDEKRAYTLRKGDTVMVSNWSMGRNKKIWGKDAILFKPERWTKGLNTFDQYKFAAFNINPRLCLGKNFAMQEAKIFGFYFIKNFRFEMVKGHKVVIRGGAILNLQNGLPITLESRKL